MARNPWILIAALLGASFLSQTANAQTGPELIARGRYLVLTGHCNNCHTAGYQQTSGKTPEKDWLTGRDVGHRGPWGTTYPANLRLNVNKMTEAEWVAYASTLKNLPGMPTWSLRATHADDLRAMYQFIKSLGPSAIPSRPALPPGEEPKTLYIRVVPGPTPATPSAGTQNAATTGAGARSAASPAVLARGRYMLVTGHCNNCHTENYVATEGNVPESEWLKGSVSGNRGTWGTTYAGNLRINVGLLTEAQWVAYAKSTQPRPPMPWWAVHETTPEDLGAMYQFIKSLGEPGATAPAFLPPDREPPPPYTVWPAVFAN
jgi:mono/diheme cytochrome c family protein